MLWGLLLGFLPILIHLFNRLRHRKLPWAAMMFLRMANRKSTRYAKLRQWLVLLFRVLVVLALIFALSKPLVGGTFTKWFSGKPDVILIVLDRSASMGAGEDPDNTLLKQAVKRIISNLKQGITRARGWCCWSTLTSIRRKWRAAWGHWKIWRAGR